MSADDATLAFYEKAAPHYTASTAQNRHRHLDPSLDRLKPGSEILELGCGCGADAARMIERGFIVDATDGTRAMLHKAKERHGLDARLMRFDQLDADRRYDAVWAHACLLHTPRAGLPGILRRVHRALKPGGWHFANFKLGDADRPDEGRDPLGRWANLPDTSWLEHIYRNAGFELVETERYRGNGADGVQRDWYALTVRVPS